MRVLRKNKIEHVYKLTCKDVELIFKNKYRKKLGSNIVTSSDIHLTPTQINFLLTIKCNGKYIIGYLKKVKKNKYVFYDRCTIVENYINLEELDLCERCLKKLVEEINIP